MGVNRRTKVWSDRRQRPLRHTRTRNRSSRSRVDTPFGAPSDLITIGSIDGLDVAFLPRHGRFHQITPTEIPVTRQHLGAEVDRCEQLISVSAVGSMRENIHPLDMVVPDQIFDRTTSRHRTFFDDLVVHVALADPFCDSAAPP